MAWRYRGFAAVRGRRMADESRAAGRPRVPLDSYRSLLHLL